MTGVQTCALPIWSEDKIRDLNITILQLNSPNKRESNFNAEFICPQLPDLPKTILNDDFLPSIQFNGLVDENGILDYELSFTPPNSVPMNPSSIKNDHHDLKIGDIDYWKKGESFRVPECGGFLIDTKVWYREKPWIDGPNAKDFKNYLDRFGGLSIYRDGIRSEERSVGKECRSRWSPYH